MPCEAEGCENKIQNRGRWCRKHYDAELNAGRYVRNYGAKRSITHNGYVRIWVPGHPCAWNDNYAYEHRVVWFDAGRPLPDGWQIHHLNCDRTDNRLENLEALTSAEHNRRHPHSSPSYGADSCTVGLP